MRLLREERVIGDALQQLSDERAGSLNFERRLLVEHVVLNRRDERRVYEAKEHDRPDNSDHRVGGERTRLHQALGDHFVQTVTHRTQF